MKDADFMYLTGVAQPNCVAMFGGQDSPAPGYTLFVPDHNISSFFSCASISLHLQKKLSD